MSLTPELLLHGYSIGIFPMAEHARDPEVFWVDPKRRGVLPLDGFHLSRSLGRRMRRMPYHLSLNRDFAGVVEGCAARPETWINPEIRANYLSLHAQGDAHSIELWEQDVLIGGVYGVVLGAAFFGESMFSRRTDASKIALAVLVAHLQQCGFCLFDTQFLTAHLARLGGVEISRATYQAQLAQAIKRHADIQSRPLPAVQEVVQRMTQTS